MDAQTLILIGIIATLVLILLTIIGALVYSGVFASFTIGAGEPPIKSLVVVYKSGKGPYKDSGYVFNETVSIAPDKRCIGFYYDDPRQVEPEQLRWAVGCIIAEGATFPDVQLIGKFQEKDYKVFHTPQVSSAVKTTFPYTTPFSIFIAIFRVYPALADYVKSKRLCAHPYLEIYDGNVIHFMAPLAKQDEFYVPEALEDEGTPERELNNDGEENEEGSEEDCDNVQKKHDSKMDYGDLSVASSTVVQKQQQDKAGKHIESDAIIPDSKDCLSVEEKSRRSISAASFRTAKGEPMKLDDVNVSKLPASGDKRILEGTPESVQDSGISSTSNRSTEKTDQGASSGLGHDEEDSSLNASSSVMDSSATSMDSISSGGSSFTSHSNSSFTSYGSNSGSSFTEDSATETSVDYLTEVSKDLTDLSSDSEIDGRRSQDNVVNK